MKLYRLLPVLLAIFNATACVPLSGDRILARDLASANSQFSALPSTLQLGYAPVPGSSRVFTVGELEQIARTGEVILSAPTELCFEFPLHVPVESEYLKPMRQALAPEASLQILEMSSASIPSGRVVFPASGLEPPTGHDKSQLWRGYVQYTESRRVPVWAKVAVSMTYSAVVARKELRAETTIDATSIQIETHTGPVSRIPSASLADQVIGLVVRQTVIVGAEIPLSILEKPLVTRRGDLVKVEVQSGHTTLRFNAVAQSVSRAGEMADLLNPASGKHFRARVEAGPRAIIVVGGGPAL